jgi:hypothetical protein
MHCTGDPLPGLFLPNTSRSYKEVGSYNLSDYEIFGSVPSAQYGLDTVTYNFSGSEGAVKMLRQTIASAAMVRVDLGLFGLSPRSANLSTDIGILQGQSRTSILQNLLEGRHLRAKIWSYQAGAFNREPFLMCAGPKLMDDRK